MVGYGTFLIEMAGDRLAPDSRLLRRCAAYAFYDAKYLET